MKKSLERLTATLPARLVRALGGLSRRYRPAGQRLFIFGSFARGEQRATSDLDLGVEWVGQREPATFRRLDEAVQALPTIRKIELVDFSQVDPAFKTVAGADKLYLSEIETVANHAEEIEADSVLGGDRRWQKK